MALTVRHRATYPFDVEALVRILTSDRFVDARERLFGAVEVRVERHHSPAGALVLTIDRVRVDADDGGACVASTLVEEWDVADGTCRWHVLSPSTGRVRLSGRYELAGVGGGAALRATCEVDVSIAEMGERVEHAIAARVQAHWVASEALARSLHQPREAA